MRVNIQSGFYGNLYNTGNKYNILSNTQFKGNKTNTDDVSDKLNQTAGDIIEFTSSNIDDDSSYDQLADEIYKEGYRDGCSDKWFNRALLSGLAVLGAINMYSNCNLKNSLENMQSQQQAQYNTLSDDLDKKFQDLTIDTYLNDKTLLEAIIDTMYMIRDLKQQENTLKEQIEALPQDSEEAQALKEELQEIIKQYEILEEKYWDYMSEYNHLENEENNEDDSNNNPADDIDSYFDGPAIYA